MKWRKLIGDVTAYASTRRGARVGKVQSCKLALEAALWFDV